MGKQKTRSYAPEFLADLIVYTKCVLIKDDIDDKRADKLAREISKQMCETWGGQLIYFPQGLRLELTERDRDIYTKFDGHNQAQLSKDYKVSIQTIYRILAYVREEEIALRQGVLKL